MKWFENYSSNTLAGSGNQLFFCDEGNTVHTGRIYYKIFAGGKYQYSLLFSNIIDSTYADGSKSHCNLLCNEWEIISASIGVTKEVSEYKAGEVMNPVFLTFDGKGSKNVMPGEFFTSDPIELAAEKGDYLCFEVTFKGDRVPYHEESILPVFVKKDGEWFPSKYVPFPGMIGCDRKVKAKIGFLGDSITQGIGTAVNSYQHWNALLAEAIGEEFSYWNLGIGYSRAADAASDGAWLYKAKQMDVVVVCHGINDIGQKKGCEQIKKDLFTIVQKLQKAGVKVLVQTLPPFNYVEENLAAWHQVNDYVRNILATVADGFFDVVPVLLSGTEAEGKAKYGPHPNEEGCKAWADELIPVMKQLVRFVSLPRVWQKGESYSMLMEVPKE